MAAWPLPTDAQADDFFYQGDDMWVTITGYKGPGGAVTIPADINGVPVFELGEWALAWHGEIASVAVSGPYIWGIDDFAFYSCTGLTNVTIPASVGYIASDAFEYCSNLQTIAVDPGNAAYSSADGVLFNKNQTDLIVCPGGRPGTYVVPASVLYLDSEAFSSCSGLTAIGVASSNSTFSSIDGVLFGANQKGLIRCPEGKTGNYTRNGLNSYYFIDAIQRFSYQE